MTGFDVTDFDSCIIDSEKFAIEFHSMYGASPPEHRKNGSDECKGRCDADIERCPD